MTKDVEVGVRLKADSDGLVKGMSLTRGELSKLQKSMKETQRVTGIAAKALAGFAMAGGAALGAMVVSTANGAREIANLSKVANTSTDDFQKMTFAAKRYGFEQDKVVDILKDVNDKVGDFLTTGAGPMADFFEKVAPQVGVTADQFRNLSGKDALQLYVSSLEKANLSQAEMTFFMEAIASDATLLLPLFRSNGKELGVLGKQAEAFGTVLSDLEIKQLAEVKSGIDDIQSAFKGASQRVVLEFLPTMKDITNLLKDPETISSIAELVKGIGEIAGAAVKAAAAVGWLGENIGEGLARALHGPDTAIGQISEKLVGAVEEYQVLEALLKNSSVNGVSILSPSEIEETTARIAELKDSADKASAAIDALNEMRPAAAKPTSGPIQTPASAFTPRQRPLSEIPNPLDALSMRDRQDLIYLESDMIESMDNIKLAVEDTTTELDQFALQAARNMQTHLADYLFDPFEDGLDGMAEGFAKVIQRMLADAAAAQVMKALIGDYGTTGKDGKTAAIGGLIGAAADWVTSANGNVFAGGNVIPFARGGVVNSPTLFPMANGAGLMGEAGPEAIIPLKRGPDGKLGVAGGGGSSVVVNINQSIDARGQGEQAAASIRNASREMAAQIETAVVSNIARRGSIYKALGR